MKLYTSFRSAAAFRVRIALNLKQLDYDSEFVKLVGGADGNEEQDPEYLRLNPQGLVPTLMDGYRIFPQSWSILEYLDESYLDAPPLMPTGGRDRARVRAIAQLVVSDIDPLYSLRVLHYLRRTFGEGETACLAWSRHWVREGLHAVESMVAGNPATGEFCHGDVPTLADVCLVPSIYSALHNVCDPEHYPNKGGKLVELKKFPTVARIYQHCMSMPEFADAAPETQSDAEAVN